MAKKKKVGKKMAGVARTYVNWHGMWRHRKNDQDKVMCYFMGAWSAFNDKQAAYFMTLCNKKDFEEMMKYPMWQ